jgi:hypothetical protein
MTVGEKMLFLFMIEPRRVFKNEKNVSLPFLFSIIEDRFGSKYLYQSEILSLLVMDKGRKPLFNISIDKDGVAVSIAHPMVMDINEGNVFYDFIHESVAY